MNVFYYLYGVIEPHSGVMKKVISQSLALSALGVNVHVIMLGFDDEEYPDYPFLKIIPISKVSNHSLIGRIKRVLIARIALSSLIKSLTSEDILYYRRINSFPLYYPINYFRLFRKCFLITEHQSIAYKEFLASGKSLLSIFEKYLSPFIINQSNAIIGVTDEITQQEISHILNQNKPHYTIGNGIIVKNYPIRNNQNLRKSCYELICVARFNIWHGLDRLIKGLNQYNGEIPIILHLVGNGIEIFNISKLQTKENPLFSIIIHGFITGEELDSLYNQCHVAIGSLAIHRKGLSMTSELKGREYCARGIPFIIACKDPDFPDEFPYILHFPPDETPIEISQIIKFIERILSEPEHPLKMREYAKNNLEWSIKIRKLKGFIDIVTVIPNKTL